MTCNHCGATLPCETHENKSTTQLGSGWIDLPGEVSTRLVVSQQGHLTGISVKGDRAITIEVEELRSAWAPVQNGSIGIDERGARDLCSFLIAYGYGPQKAKTPQP